MMVNCDKSLKGYLLLPFRIRKEINERKKNKNRINQFKQTIEIERAKQHLSYKFGVEILKAEKNPLLWMLLPFNLSAAYKQWLNNKNKKINA